LLGNVGVLVVLAVLWPWLVPDQPERSARPVSLVILSPEEEEEELEEEEEEEEEEPEGQIVEVAPPEEEEVPEESDYLAEYDMVVEEETRSDKFKVNPEVLAPQYSQEEVFEKEDVVDLNVEKESTGATEGNHRFDPNTDGSLAALPSPWKLTNKEGPQDPVPSAQTTTTIAGAPQNDLLREKRADQVALNTKEYLYAGYLKRIRRLVNYYWQQNLDNLPSSATLSRPRYSTAVEVVLNSEGALEVIEVTKEAGVPELDDCVVRAFRAAGPFDNPPEGLIEKDGRVYLPVMDFTVELSTARAQYQGIDPRAGVQFPGILKSPR
jgi:protein TonB